MDFQNVDTLWPVYLFRPFMHSLYIVFSQLYIYSSFDQIIFVPSTYYVFQVIIIQMEHVLELCLESIWI